MRLAFAIAIQVDPDILLVDDTLAVGDEDSQRKCIKKIFELKEYGKTIVFVTHNVREAACLGDRVLLFSPHPGHIQESFSVDLSRPRDINSVDLAKYSTEITRSLKRHLHTGTAEVAE